MYNVTDVCLPIYIDVEQTTFQTDPAWIGLAFLLGVIVAALLVTLCLFCCIQEWKKKKSLPGPLRHIGKCMPQEQDDEEVYLESIQKENVVAAVSTERETRGRKKISLQGRKRSTLVPTPEEDDQGEDKTVSPAQSRGMADILTKETGAGTEAELTEQDMDAVIHMTKTFTDEKDAAFLKMLKLRLKKMKGQGKITDPYLADLMQKVIDDRRSGTKVVQTEKEEKAEELRRKHGKNTVALQSDLDQLEWESNQTQSQLDKEEKETIRQHLLKTSGLSEAEVDELMEKLKQDMANLEKKLGDEQARQARSLEERLARRRQILEYRRMQKQQEEDEIQVQKQVFEEPLKKLVMDGKLLERQKNDILDEHDRNLQQMHKQHQTDAFRQEQDLAEKLRVRRLKRMQKLADKHDKEKALFMERSEKGVDTADFAQGYHQLLQQQRAEAEQMQTELDNLEVEELDKVTQGMETVRNKEIKEANNKMLENLRNTAQVTDGDVNRLLKLHKQQMAAYENQKLEERERMAAKLREKWQQKMQQLEVEEQRSVVDRDTLVEQQRSTVEKVLATNMDLTEEAKKKILLEHEANMQALNNRLQLSKLRQQKSLDHKLSQRRARVEELRAKQDEAKRAKNEANYKEIEKMEHDLEIQLQEEEKRLENEKATAMANLRHQIAMETESALRQQELDLGRLIGRLEVGHARRQSVLRKQDSMLQKLQEQLEKRVAQGDIQPKSYVDQMIQQHYNQVEQVNQQLQNLRERQEQVLQEKIQTKQLRKQRELESQIQEETQESFSSLRRRGAGLASSILGQMLLEQRHQNALNQLEQDMKVELEKSKENLNRELEHELQQELTEQKQQLLSQLAAASNISQSEINDAVDAAVTGTGGDTKAGKKLAKNLRTGIKQAKTMEFSDEEEEEPQPTGLRRQKIGAHPARLPALPADMQPRPLSGTKKKKKVIPKKHAVAPIDDDEGMYDEDDF